MSPTKVSTDFDIIILPFSGDTADNKGDIGITSIEIHRPLAIRLIWALMHVNALEDGELMVSVSTSQKVCWKTKS
jgi:hypothetical protein